MFRHVQIISVGMWKADGELEKELLISWKGVRAGCVEGVSSGISTEFSKSRTTGVLTAQGVADV